MITSMISKKHNYDLLKSIKSIVSLSPKPIISSNYRKFSTTTTGKISTLKINNNINNIKLLSNNKFLYNNNNNKYYSTTSNTSTGQEQILRKVVTTEQQEIFKKNYNLIESIYKDLNEFEDSNISPLASVNQQVTIEKDRKLQESLRLLKDSLEQLKDSLFLLVVVGEFNSGKSSFLNALLGNQFLKEGITPTTSRINILKYGDKQQHRQVASGLSDEDHEVIQLPVSWLKDISLVDTPGTNAVIKGHQEITEHFIPKSDLVLFVTSVDRAFSESEAKFLSQIKQWGKKIIVVLSKADLVDRNPLASNPKADLDEVIKFIQENFKAQLGVVPVVFPVSSKLALKGKLEVSSQPSTQSLQQFNEKLSANTHWQSSRFSELEQYILHSLDSTQRTKLKLLNPLGVATNILDQFALELHSRNKVLSIDIQTVRQVSEQLDHFQKEIKEDFQHHLDRIENILLKMETRADKFLDDQIKLGNIMSLLRGNEVKHLFERDVIGATSHDIELQMSSMIDWIVDKNIKQWKSIMDHINQRSSSRLEKVIGTVNKGSNEFLYNRQTLLSSMGTHTTQALGKYNKDVESTKVHSDIKSAIYQTAAVEMGAVGIATFIATSLLDLTGILGVGALALGGLAILPMKKAALKKSVHSKIQDLRLNLEQIISSHFENEMENGISKIKASISPYSSYINFEVNKLKSYQDKIDQYQDKIKSQKFEIEQLK
ncbi:hypothetical protein DLAC_06178 [Tieghemostelium lacteum]|uniref:Dynamin N-terminal domain-containing protein n=1 Tax=Tieghemostelium lacteum TaxID=361077 RepID=A0A151ZHU3_TIELA|nr:hypothetical protein DLAC_06178 [Tieghemostelium lacteum]|eukprot:KYQ93485.1 hypothetical protein DLAC_06178 [Tieghemostelium lacteum]